MFGLDDIVIGSIIASGVSGVANTALGLANYNYQKDLQRTIFGREDSSIARRVADLKASGLSPVLAAGQGAGSGGIVSTKPPEVDTQMISAIQNLLTMRKDFAVKDEQIKLLKSQQGLNNVNKKIRDLDYYYYDETGISPNSSAFGKAMRDFVSMYSKMKGEEFVPKLFRNPENDLNQRRYKLPKDKKLPFDKTKTKKEVKPIYDENFKKVLKIIK